MDLTSLGFRTDLAVLALSGSEIEDRGDHLVVRTPDNPTYFWGNFVVFAHAPEADEALAVFAAAFPEADHVAIGIDDGRMAEPTREAYAAQGVTGDESVVLTGTALTAPAPVDAEVRPLASEEDWEARARLTLALETAAEDDAVLTFARRRNAMERSLVEAGRGQRWGAFVDGVLVSTAACFTLGDGLARYQSVETHPGHRRRGLAAAVVHAAGTERLASGVERLVIVADEGGPAIEIYRRLGLADAGTQLQLERRGGAWASPE